MEVNLSIPMGNTAATGAGSAQGQGTSKSDAQPGLFGSMLQAAGAGNAETDTQEATDPLLALMAALSGGLSPMMLFGQQLQAATGTGAEGAEGLLIHATFNGNPIQLDLRNITLNNGDFAKLLQDFGASPALLGVLMEQPLGQPAQTLAAHPELLGDLGKSMTQMIQTVAAQPQVLSAQPQIAQLMENLLANVKGSQEQLPNGSGEAVKVPKGYGKMLASISTHSLQINVAEQQTTMEQGVNPLQGNAGNQSLQAGAMLTGEAVVANAPTLNEDQNAPTSPLLANGALLGTPLRLQHEVNRANADSVVQVRADQFKDEFAGLLVKRAALMGTPGNQEFRIVLQPHGLGEIEVRVQTSGSQISLQFAADTAAAKGLLDAELGTLKAQLQAQGIPFSRIEVTTSNTNAELAYGGMPQERGSSQQYEEQKNQGSNDTDADPFSIDALSELQAEEETIPEEDGIDVNA